MNHKCILSKEIKTVRTEETEWFSEHVSAKVSEYTLIERTKTFLVERRMRLLTTIMNGGLRRINKMKKTIVLVAFLCISLLLVGGCGVHGVRHERGNPINEANVKQIVDGKTKVNEVLGLFGSPDSISTIGSNEIYVYKNCKTDGAGFAIMGFGHTGTRERCNSLSITVDKTTGIVQSHNFQKMFDTE